MTKPTHLDDPANSQVIGNAQAAAAREVARETGGNTFHAMPTSPLTGRVQIRAIPAGEIRDILTNPVLEGIAERVGKSVAQVIIRWHLQIGNVVIPKSVTPARIAENFDVLDFELTEDDLHAISDLDDKDGRIGPHPNDLN